MNSLGAIGRKLAENDPAEALAFVDSLPYEDERRRVLSNMNWTLRQQSIEVSSRLVAENRDPMVQQQLASGIAEEWSKYDVAGALAWSESLSDEQARKSAVGNVLGNWIESDPVATLRYIETNIDPEVQSSVLQSAFNSWSRSDPQEAASWLSRLPEGIDARLEPMYRSVANAYIQHDPMAASEWISGLSESPERDLSIETLVNNIANTDPEAGFMWASAMGNGNRRNNSLRRSVLAWKKLDEQAAYQAVIDARIDAEEKAPLLKIFEDGS
ncbi:MAG: hypothetical protein EA353_00160 [Puniceicoccaceae bacterium]|nr:MAG: hypothetical protein EA353_00160 [Puniceicoccaceae bacterium]